MQVIMTPEQRKQMEKKFRGHDRLHSKYIPQIPASAEREYLRLSNQYMSILKKAMEEGLPEIKKAYMKEMEEQRADGFHTDAKSALFHAIDKAFERIRKALTEQLRMFKLRERLDKLVSQIQRLTAHEYPRLI